MGTKRTRSIPLSRQNRTENKGEPKSKFRLTAIRAAREQTLRRPHVSQRLNTPSYTQVRPLYLVITPVPSVQKTSFEILLLVLGSRDQTRWSRDHQTKHLRLIFASRTPQIVDNGRSQNRINCDGASKGSICDPLPHRLSDERKKKRNEGGITYRHGR